MYGMLLMSIQQSIVERYGEDRWQAVLATAVALGDHRTATLSGDIDNIDHCNAVRSGINRSDGQPIVLHTHEQYPDDLLSRIAVACVIVLRQLVPLVGRIHRIVDHVDDGEPSATNDDRRCWPIGTADEFLRSFGHCFVGYTTRLGFDRVMGSLGRHFRDFLANIDNLHETLRFTYRQIVSPSFCITEETENGCVLHYR